MSLTDIAAAETALLSAMLCFPSCIDRVSAIVVSNDFYDEVRRNIFNALIAHHREGRPVEIPALAISLQHHREAVYELTGLIEIASTGETAPHYAHQVAESARLRQIKSLASVLLKRPNEATEILVALSALTCGKAATRKPIFTSAASLLSEQLVIDYVIDQLIEVDATGQIFGPSGGGKSFIALCLSLAIATGNYWNGRKTSSGLILYLAGEGRKGIVRRLKAWTLRNAGTDISRFHLSTRTIALDGSGAAEVIHEGQTLADSSGYAIKLIVVDTLARHLPGDENSTKDMSAFIEAVDSVRSAFPGSTAIIVHHTGNGEDTKTRSRGSSALKAAMDFEIRCDKGQLTFTKMKDTEPPPPIDFKLVPIQIGTDDDGEQITSCVVEYGSRSIKNREQDLTVNERLLAGLVHQLSDRLELRIAFNDARRGSEPDIKSDALKKAFDRALCGLVEKGFIDRQGNTIIKTGTFSGHFGTCPGRDNEGHRDIISIEMSRVPSLVPPSQNATFGLEVFQ